MNVPLLAGLIVKKRDIPAKSRMTGHLTLASMSGLGLPAWTQGFCEHEHGGGKPTERGAPPGLICAWQKDTPAGGDMENGWGTIGFLGTPSKDGTEMAV